ncbi:unnamed protein product [Dovyalis caffra]|uniref:Uncharacterized protein n=1 Tax=Dovyalis caffra TaxID=77055 RepID=A0AAV1S5P2_9ROSI|nr:unnamed protein product [Dovyalis caffra]
MLAWCLFWSRHDFDYKARYLRANDRSWKKSTNKSSADNQDLVKQNTEYDMENNEENGSREDCDNSDIVVAAYNEEIMATADISIV